MKVSFVIPAFNEQYYIERSLKQFSGYRNRYDFEIIVVDGQSTDDTVKIVRKYADRIIVEKHKSTIAAARNLGAYAAKGEIIIEMDAEVTYSDFPLLMSLVQKYFSDPNNVAATVKFHIYPEEANWKDKLIDFFINTSIALTQKLAVDTGKGECQIFRKDAFIKVGGYNNELCFGEDGDLYRRLKNLGRFKVFKEINAYCSSRRFHKNGYLRVLFVDWFWNWLVLTITGKPYFKTWKPAR